MINVSVYYVSGPSFETQHPGSPVPIIPISIPRLLDKEYTPLIRQNLFAPFLMTP